MVKTLFQLIIVREIPARIEFEDGQCIVIHDIQPQAPVHLLIIPKQVIVRADDGKVYGELLVLAVSHAWVKTYPLHWVDLDKVNASVSAKGAESMSGFSIEHKGPHLQWCVVRKNPSGIVHSGEPDEERARSWLIDYLKATRVQVG